MENASFSSGIFAGEHESVSFGRHFRDRSPEISEVVQSVGTPPEMMYRSSDTGWFNFISLTFFLNFEHFCQWL